MKRSTFFMATFLACTITVPAFAIERRDVQRSKNPNSMNRNPVSSVTTQIDLAKMWEEEKLARDVYTALSRQTKMRIFQNISQAENQHMLALSRTMQSRGISTAALDATPGVFSFPEYRKLYQSLVAEGSKGMVNALMVGAKIEEMDIADLQSLLNATDDRQISQVLQQLMRGSYNHLRAFDGLIVSQGVRYQPTFLSQDEYDTIAGTPSGRGGQGGGHARGQGQRLGPGGRGAATGGKGYGKMFGTGGGQGRGRRSR